MECAVALTLFMFGMCEEGGGLIALIIYNTHLHDHELAVFAAVSTFHGVIAMIRACMMFMYPHNDDEHLRHNKTRIKSVDSVVLCLGIVVLADYSTRSACDNSPKSCIPHLLVQTWWCISVLMMVSRCVICFMKRQLLSMIHQVNVEEEIPVPGSRVFFVNQYPLMQPNRETCCICLDVDESQQWRLLPCSHCYHAECVDPWLLSRGTCPSCRFIVPIVAP